MSFRNARAFVYSLKKVLMQVSNYTLKLRNSSRGFVTFISVQALLKEEINCAFRQIPWPTRNILGKKFAIPLTIKQQGNLIHYRSAIALALASEATIEATQIAQNLTAHLQQKLSPELIPIQDLGGGWIEFTLTETAIQQWLQQSLSLLPGLSVSLPSTMTPLSFPQYTYHRCCRILQLGAEANLISLTDSTANGANCSFAEQNLLAPEDWRFIYQLINTIDRLANRDSSKPLAKVTNDLSEAFVRFHRYCRIFDGQQPHFPQIAMIRLNCIAIAQALLEHLIDPFLVTEDS